MPLTTAQQALKAPNAQAITAVIMRPTDPASDDAEVVVPVADGAFWTGDSGPNAGLAFKNVIKKDSGFDFTESLTKPGQLTTARSQFKRGTITAVADASMTSLWPGLDWNGKPVEIYFGARYKADGTEMVLADFDLITGVIDELRAVGDGEFEVTFADPRLSFEQKLSDTVYRGFGGGFQISGDPADLMTLSSAHVAQMDLTGAITLFWVGTVDAFRGSGVTPLIMNGGTSPLSVNWALMIDDSTQELAFAGGLDGGDNSTLVNSSFTITAGQPAVLVAVVDGDGVSVSFYAGADGASLAAAGTATLPDALATGPTDGVFMGESGSSDFTPWEAHVFTVAKTFPELQELADATITDAATRSNLREGWRFAEGVEIGAGPEIVFGEKNLVDFSPVGGGTPTWVSSYEGDEPDIFAGSVAGTTKARVYGGVTNALLARLDTQRHVHGWDFVASDDLTQLRQRGVPMVLDQTIAAASAGDFDFDAAARTVTITDPAVGDFKKFIPGQFEPARLGQRVRVGGSSINAGIYRVAKSGITADGLTMTLVDRALQTESAPADTTIATYAPDAQYTIDLTRSIVTLLSEPDGHVTGDLVGRLPVSGTARWSELFEMITGIVPDVTALTLDPVLGFQLSPNSTLTINQVLDEMARSAFGWWIEDGAGGYRIGNFSEPSGSPVEVFENTHMDRVEPLKSLKPHWRFEVGYRRIWHIQEGDELASSLSQADAQLYGEEYTYVPATDRTVLDKWPTATEHDSFKTWLTELDDANAFVALAWPLLCEKRYWFKLRFGNLAPLNVRLYDVIEVSWLDDPTLGLIDTACRVTSRQVDTGNYTMTLEVHT